MLLELKIKLTTGFYGGGSRNGRNVRALERTPTGDIQIRTDVWLRKLENAAKDLSLDVNLADSVKLPASFIPPTIRILKRKYYNKGMKVDYFEGFGANTEICIDIVLQETAAKAPTLLELKKIFHIFGSYYGISQFGANRFGLGRFSVVYLDPKTI